ncbi:MULTISPECIES: ABC transporter ATP-binding protein [Terrabacteria group]|uniref:ABC transporter ATP-binding protein n=1 Tax=Bacillati TaxID=1783272 RepID=UPI00193A3ADD|nr:MULTISPECIES: ABC transporter ATP-binding protein [Terrabacteria group]MBW9213047.1 ABC transporter ATP-binding protein [Trueperella sp. zg.1013]QRG87422.1 ABC transporter ATP-binding protein [Bulleidia sp. zg-1006]
MLKITNLHKSYGNKEVLHGISLEVEDGHIFGFIGHNGSGKSTTIRSVVGILKYQSGLIEIDGLDIQKYPLEVKQRTAFLPDNPDLYDNLSAYQYLNFIGDMVGLEPSLRLQRIETLAKELEIADVLGDKIKSLSHGMKQKVAIISAFMREPKLLVLDEPFVGLDPKATFILKNKMKELTAKGSSIFFSSHVLETVQNLCDDIAILSGGQIVKMGTTKELLESGESLEDLFLSLEHAHE